MKPVVRSGSRAIGAWGLQILTSFALQLIDTIFSDRLHPEEFEALKADVAAMATEQFPDAGGKLVDQEQALRACIFAWHKHEAGVDQVRQRVPPLDLPFSGGQRISVVVCRCCAVSFERRTRMGAIRWTWTSSWRCCRT